jgi:hypothetical protein
MLISRSLPNNGSRCQMVNENLLVGYNSVQSGTSSPTLRRNILPPAVYLLCFKPTRLRKYVLSKRRWTTRLHGDITQWPLWEPQIQYQLKFFGRLNMWKRKQLWPSHYGFTSCPECTGTGIWTWLRVTVVSSVWGTSETRPVSLISLYSANGLSQCSHAFHFSLL